MERRGKLRDAPFMEEMRKLIKPLYMSEIEEAIEQENDDIIEKLLYKYLRKKEAQEYFPKVIGGLRKYNINRRNSKEVPKEEKLNWDESQIVVYLSQRLDIEQVGQVCSFMKSGDYDLCHTLLKDLLRFGGAEGITSHIQNFIQQNNKDKHEPQKKIKQDPNYQQEIFKYLQNKLESKKSNKISRLLKDKKVHQALKQLQNTLTKSQYEFLVPQIKNNFQQGKEISKKSTIENPQKQGGGYKSIIQVEDAVEEIRNERKEKLLQKLEEELEDAAKFQEVQDLLNQGKVGKAQKIIRSLLGIKHTKEIMKQIHQFYVEKKNRPLQNAVYLQNITPYDNIKYYELQTEEILKHISQNDISNVLIVGMTGVGKSTYLNSIVNYFMAVEMEDDFRYIVSKDMFKNGQGKSSTTKVNIYGIPKQGRMKKAIRLIDIPGLGNTGGIKKDQEHIKMIYQKIKQKIPYINLIIYIFKSSDTRITSETQYVIDQIMGLFGKDVGTNILFLLTFADNSQPRVLQSLQASFPTIIKQIKNKNQEWYVKVNNSALFKKIDINDPLDVTFYTMGQICLEKTTKIIQNYSKVSTYLTINVMQKRKHLQTAIEGLNELIDESLLSQQKIRKIAEEISNNKLSMSGLEYKVKYKDMQIISQKTQNMVTTCMNCKFTCYKNCSRTNEKKNLCVAMKDGFCKICPSKCSWEVHINDHQILKRVQVQVEKTNEELYKKYKIQADSKTKNQQILLQLLNQYSFQIVQTANYCQQLRVLHQQLAEIELRKINHANVVQYIKLLIQNQKNEKKQGYLDRIKQYQKIKQYEERLQKTLNPNQIQSTKQIHELMKTKIQDLIQNKDIAHKLLQVVTRNLENIKRIQQDRKLARQEQKKMGSPGQ